MSFIIFMPREPKRQGKTIPFVISCPVTLSIGTKDIIDYCKVDSRGYPIFRRPTHAFRKATVIVGHRDKYNLTVTPNDKVFTCVFGRHGHLSSVGKELEGKELTVIVHIPEEN
jgi:hypothetical protein